MALMGSTEERALALLGQGIDASVVASACGVSESRISQLMGDEEFLAKVATLRFDSLQKHNARDAEYDELEGVLVGRVRKMFELEYNPMKLLKALQVINACKRRGQSAPEQILQKNTVVSLTMPVNIIQKFTTNINNQVIHAGEQTLQTVQSSGMAGLSRGRIQESSAVITESAV